MVQAGEHGSNEPGSGQEDTSQPDRDRPSWKLRAAGAVGLVVVAGLIVPLLYDSVSGKTADLRVSLDVRNGSTQAEDVPDGGGMRMTADTQPVIYVNVRNDGEQGAAIDRVQLAIEDAARVRFCEPRGSGGIDTWTSGVSLPVKPQPGQTLEPNKRVAFAIGADDQGSFALRLKPRQSQIRRGHQWLYRFNVRLRQVSNREWTDAGTATVLIWTVYAPDFDGTATENVYDVAAYRRCAARNRRTLRHVVGKGEGEMSRQLRAILTSLD